MGQKKYQEEDQSPKFKLNSIRQRRALQEIKENHITLLSGPAGSGKTLLACYAGLNLLSSNEINKIVVCRLISETDDEKLGALPGEMAEKLAYVTNPLLDNLTLLLPISKIKALFTEGIIEAIPVSHIRGRSFHYTLIIVEECQNLTPLQIKKVLTRIGPGSKIVLTGDPQQVDFRGRNGVHYAADLLRGLPGCGVVELDYADIMRHPVLPALLERANLVDSKWNQPLGLSVIQQY